MHHGHTGKQEGTGQAAATEIKSLKSPPAKQSWLKAAGHRRAGCVLPVETDRQTDWGQQESRQRGGHSASVPLGGPGGC